MRTSVIFILLTTIEYRLNALRTTTVRIDERIRYLKFQIRNNLRNPPVDPPDPMPAYYESDENKPIQPILEDDLLKKDDKFKLQKIKTEPTTKLLLRADIGHRPLGRVGIKERVTSISKALTPALMPQPKLDLDIFYRKSFDKNLFNTPLEWMHCSELITPFLKGAKKRLTRPNKIRKGDYIIQRIGGLLKSNISKMSRGEKRSIMYQISKLKIRLFAWDVVAMDLLYDTIAYYFAKGVTGSGFTILKRAVQNLLKTLNADVSNRTRLLAESRLFRPPCIQNKATGSSKFVRGSTQPMPSSIGRMGESSIECVRRGINIC